MDWHSCSSLISVLLFTHHIGKITLCILGQNGVFTVWKGWYSTSLVCQLCVAIIYEVSCFIFKNNSQNKQVTHKTNMWLETIPAKKLWFEFGIKNAQFQENDSTGTSPILYMISLSATLSLKQQLIRRQRQKQIIYWKLTSTIINNAPLIRKMFAVSSFNFSIVLTALYF